MNLLEYPTYPWARYAAEFCYDAPDQTYIPAGLNYDITISPENANATLHTARQMCWSNGTEGN